RILRHTGGARLVVRNGVPVARTVGGKMMAPDDAGKALPLRHAGNVHRLSYLEDVDADFSADLEIFQLAFRHAELAQDVTGLDRGTGEMAGSGLVDAGSAALAERDLHGAVAVGRARLDLRSAVVGHGNRHRREAVGDVGHKARKAKRVVDR